MPHLLTLVLFTAVATSCLADGPAPGLKLDAHDDPLPPHAVARFGSVRFRGPLAAGPDNTSLATLRDNKLCLVDATTGAVTKPYAGPEVAHFEADYFAVSADFRRVMYLGYQGAHIWDLGRGTLAAVLPPLE